MKQVSLPLGIYPFVKLDLGLATNFDLGDGNCVSFYYSPGIGVSLPLKGDTKSIDLGISYAPIYMEKNYTYYSYSEEQKYKNHGTCRITLGYTF